MITQERRLDKPPVRESVGERRIDQEGETAPVQPAREIAERLPDCGFCRIAGNAVGHIVVEWVRVRRRPGYVLTLSTRIMNVVIVGNGIAGVTAARHVRKADPDAQITMISGEAKEPFARTALMYVYMGVLTREHTWMYEERFWDENRIARVSDHARGLDVDRQTLALEGGPMPYDRLLIATGSKPRLPPWPGADLEGVQGLYHWSDLDRLEAATPNAQQAVVVGGGLIGVELAEMLTVRGIGVTFLVRDGRYLPLAFSEMESALVADAIRAHGVDLRFGLEIEAIEGTGRVEAVVTSGGDRFPADIVGVGTGVVANVAWLGDALEVGDQGVLVDSELQTSAPNVWAAGDCAELRDPPAGVRAREPIWYTARLQGAVAGLGMAGQPRQFDPGVYFNSAKFFDLEWQTYGRVDSLGQDWEWTDGRRSIRIRHNNGAVLGVNGLGVRLRQETCSNWIAQRWSLEAALADLEAARFDPEFTGALAR